MKNETENNLKINNNTNNKLIIIIIILSIAVISLIGYISYDKYFNKNNQNNNITTNDKTDNKNEKDELEDTETENNNDNNIVNSNSSNLDFFNFNELKTVLEKDNNKIYKETCTQLSEGNGESLGEFDYQKNELSKNTIDTIVKKLNSAKSLEKEITYSSFGCSPRGISYYVENNNTERIFSIIYADDEKTLLVGYNNSGYAFTFETKDELNNFIENLK